MTGAGPIGLLAALLAVQRGLRVDVLDRATEGPKPRLAAALGAGYTSGTVRRACAASELDIVIECTGAPEVVVEAIQSTTPGAVVCLTGVSPRGRTLSVDVGSLNDEIVLENDVALGSVNANHRHFRSAADALARADHDWLEGLITRRVPLARWAEALDRRPEDIKTVIDFDHS